MNSSKKRPAQPLWLVSALGVVLHIGLVLREYPPGVFRRGEPPLKGDVSRYFATAWSVRHVRGLYGYDPFFMAGYPVGLWNSMGKKGFELVAKAFPKASLERLFWLTLVGVSCLAPLLYAAGLRGEFAPGWPRVVWLLVTLLYWHLETMISYFWQYGNVFFPATAALLVLVTHAAGRMTQSPRRRLRAAVIGLALAAIFYGHPALLPMALLPLGTVLTLQLREGDRGRVGQAWAVTGAVALALALPWLVPLIRTWRDCLPLPRPFLESSWKHWVMDTFSDRGYRQHFDRKLLLHVALVLGTFGIVQTFRPRPSLRPLAMGGLSAWFVTYLGSYLAPLRILQPYRMLIPAVLFLLPLAAGAGIDLGRRIQEMPRRARTVVIVLLILLLPPFTGYLLDLARPRLACGISPEKRAVMRLILQTGGEGRVWCDDMRTGHMIPYYCGRPVLGGLSAQAFTRHALAAVSDDGRVIGRTPAEWSEPSMRQWLDTYGVDLAVLKTRGWQRWAEQHPALLEPVGRVQGFAVYRIRDAHPSLVLTGSAARVTATWDSVDVEGAGAGRIVLKLHFMPGLKTDRGVILSPEVVPGCPLPFMACEVPPGVTSFRIRR